MRVGFAVALAGLLFVPAAHAQSGQVLPQVPTPLATQRVLLTVSEPVVVEVHHGFKDMEFTLQNASDQTVVAWAVRVGARYADGSLIGNITTVDGYREYEGFPTERPAVVRPGETLRTRVELGRHIGRPEPLDDARVTLVGAMLLDGRPLPGIPLPFEIASKRQRTCAAWSAVVYALESVDRGKSGRARLLAAVEAVELTKNERFPMVPGPALTPEIERSILLEAESALRSALYASPDPPPPDQAVTDYLEKARREATAAQRHLVLEPVPRREAR